MSRWLLVLLGLAIAAAALYALVAGRELPLSESAPPLDDIDEASRHELERVLRDADRAEP